MIEKISLKFGRSPSSPPENIFPTPVTIFVGPNNSGKSMILREIHGLCVSGESSGSDTIVGSVDFHAMTVDEANEAIKLATGYSVDDIVNETDPYRIFGALDFGGGATSINKHSISALQNVFTEPQNPTNNFANKKNFSRMYLDSSVLSLGGKQRIDIVSKRKAGNLHEKSRDSFQVLFRNKSKRYEVRRILHEAFGKFFIIDPTDLGELSIRFSNVEPPDEMTECGLHEAAIEFQDKALPIGYMSDGIKAFTGTIIEAVAGQPKILLIDEPEAFLHPALAYKLGQELSRTSSKHTKNFFASTHSPAFLMGCISAGVPISIVRLTYRDEVATARVLPSDNLLELMRNPLLRSTGLLSGLFYEFVVVTESDADRAFYQEINERLLRLKPEWGIPHCLFINAQNKQTVWTLVEPLRALGIPAVGIVDIDAVKDGGKDWSKMTRSASVPYITSEAWGTMRHSIKTKFEQSGKNMKREGGVEILETADKEAAVTFLNNLAEYGIFVVPNGELECWLKHLGASGHGPDWLIRIFEMMGENPESLEYVRPSNGDVWEFMSRIRAWMTNPQRRGIPS